MASPTTITGPEMKIVDLDEPSRRCQPRPLEHLTIDRAVPRNQPRCRRIWHEFGRHHVAIDCAYEKGWSESLKELLFETVWKPIRIVVNDDRNCRRLTPSGARKKQKQRCNRALD